MALLATAVVGLAVLQVWTLIHLLRQNGRLLLRLEAVEGRAGAAVEAPPAGLPFDTVAPPFRLEALEGGTVGLNTLLETGKPLILFFSEPGCSACEEILPAVGQWQRELADALTIIPISRGEVKVNRAKSAEHKVQNMLLQADREVAGAYLVEATPSAVLITEGRIASPLAVGPDMIRALVGRATLPPSVKKGESVPSLRFADLEGKTVDLAKLRGRRRLLLFWNPTCGYCQQMLEDVRTWERNPPPEAPELLVISAGTYDGIREQGFRSRVLLDPNFGAGQVFSAAGTPAAVVLDEDGRVASDVGVGAQAVLALAGGRQLN